MRVTTIAVLDGIGKCLAKYNNDSNVVESCAGECGLPFGHGPLRLDSSPSAMINPSVFLDGIETTCRLTKPDYIQLKIPYSF